MEDNKLIEYEEPEYIESYDLDCEPNQDLRKMLYFCVGEQGNTSEKVYAFVIAKMSLQKNGEYEPIAYAADENDKGQAYTYSPLDAEEDKFLLSEKIRSELIKKGKCIISQEYELLNKKNNSKSTKRGYDHDKC